MGASRPRCTTGQSTIKSHLECDTLQLARTSQHRSMKQWRQESLEEVRACMNRWLMEHQAWLEEIAERGALSGNRKRGL